MRGFIVLCLAAVAAAAPQGYNYIPASGGQSVLGGAGFASNNLGSFGSSGGAFTTGSAGGAFTTGSAGGAFTNGGGSAGFFQGGQSSSSFFNQGPAAGQNQQPIISKRFYIHSAPEDAEEEYKERHITVGVPRKNYNVVFIKSPHRSNSKASIKISPAVNEEKTVIYVLNKKTDTNDINAEVIEHAAPTSKPEVFFIKYKTNEEAQHAQQQIQSQYDALGGSSQVTDEGYAPVTSVIGSLGGGDNGAGASAGAGQGFAHAGNGVSSSLSLGGSAAGSNAYLPPSH